MKNLNHPIHKLTFIFLAALPTLVSCKPKNARNLILWTNNVEFVSYAELFNSLQDEIKIMVVYKDTPESELPVKKNSEPLPDIAAGTYLQEGMKAKKFASLNSLFSSRALDREAFYQSLLSAGKHGGQQYLLPVSFNLPALVFSPENYDYLEQKNFLSFDEIQEISKKFNEATSNVTMGFAPHWDRDFLYLIFRTKGIKYNIDSSKIQYDQDAFKTVLETIKAWSEETNGGVQNEQDFAFKYLYMPFYNQVQAGRSLFAYAPSDKIMELSETQLDDIDFRWICNDEKIQVEENAVMMGIPSQSKNKSAAKKFIAWFMNEEAQKKMIDRKFSMKLKTLGFGIAGGFSSIKSVNEKLMPTYYRPLLSNLPPDNYLVFPQTLPSDWEAIKNSVLLPFISDNTDSLNIRTKTLNERYTEYLITKHADQK